MKLKIEGVITPTRPLHVATSLAPDMRYDYTTRRPSFGDGGMPMTGTVTKGLLVSGQDRPDHVPYFPANDIRGRLRRHATKTVLEALQVRGEAVHINTFDGMNAGNFSGRPDTAPTTLAEMQVFTQHFFMGLFGGGPRTLPSKLVTHDLDPIYAGTLSLGTVPSRFEDLAFTGKAYDMTDVFGCIRRDDTSNFTNLVMMDCIHDALNAINDRQDELSQARNKRKKAKAKDQSEIDEADTAALKKSDLANMFAYQCIRAGLPLYLELGFSSEPTKAQVGLLLEALLRIFNENALGGLVRIGSGRFEGFANLVVDGVTVGPILQRQQSGVESSMDAGFVLTDLADEYIDAKDDAIAASSAAELDRFFKYGEPVEELSDASAEAA